MPSKCLSLMNGIDFALPASPQLITVSAVLSGIRGEFDISCSLSLSPVLIMVPQPPLDFLLHYCLIACSFEPQNESFPSKWGCEKVGEDNFKHSVK